MERCLHVDVWKTHDFLFTQWVEKTANSLGACLWNGEVDEMEFMTDTHD
jgi:hypothetical protein